MPSDSPSQCPACGKTLRPGRPATLCPPCLTKGWQQAQRDEPAPELPAKETQRLFAIPGHDILEEIARGGMGIVYRAVEHTPSRAVAVKMLLPQLATDDLRERFRTEARVMASLSHSGILPLYRYGEHAGVPWFSMPLCQDTLAKRLTTYHKQWQRVAQLLAHLAEAVAFAHNHGVLHRDIKPGNVLFDREDRVFLSDFGLAKILTEDAQLTQSLSVIGTPHYLAPELIKASGNASTASDVYSLGAILYELLAERPVFNADSVAAILRQIAEDDPAPLPSSVPRDLGTIAFKCLSKEPANRYTSAQELADDLHRWLNNEPVRARRLSTPELLALWCKRKPALAAMSAMLAATLMIAVGLVIAKNQELKMSLAQSQASRRAEVLTLASATRKSASLFDRDTALNAIREAVKIRPGEDLEEEATGLLALPCVTLSYTSEPLKHWWSLVPDADLKIAVDATDNKVMRIVDIRSRKELATLPGGYIYQNKPVDCFSRDGELIAYREDKTQRLVVRQWRTGSTLLSVPSKGLLSAMIAPDSKHLVAGRAEGMIVCFDLEHPETPPKEWPIGNLKDSYPAAFSPDSCRLAVLGKYDTYALIDMATGTVRLFSDSRMKSTLTYCTWIGDASGILGGYASGAIRARSSLFAGGYRDLPRQYSSVTGLSIQAQGQLAVTNGTENRAMFLDWPSGRVVGTEAGGSYLTRFSADGNSLVMESSNGVLRLYDVKPSPVARQYVDPDTLSNGFNNISTPLAVIRPDGRLIASIRNGAVDFFDMHNTIRLGTMTADRKGGLAWLKGGREFLLAESAGISRWSMTDNADGSINVKKLSLTPVDGYMYRTPQVAESADLWAMAADQGVYLGIISGLRRDFVPLPKRPEDKRTLTYLVALSSDGHWLAVTDLNTNECMVLDVPKREWVFTHKLIRQGDVQFANNNRELWIDGYGELLRFRCGTWEQLPAPSGPKPEASRSFAAPATMNGKLLVTVHRNETWLRDGETGQRILRFQHPLPIPMHWVNATPDGQWIACSGSGDVGQIWNLSALAAELKKLGLPWRGPEMPPVTEPRRVTKLIIEK